MLISRWTVHTSDLTSFVLLPSFMSGRGRRGGGGKGHLFFSLPPTSAVCSVDVNSTNFTSTVNSDLPSIADVGGRESQADVFSRLCIWVEGSWRSISFATLVTRVYVMKCPGQGCFS